MSKKERFEIVYSQGVLDLMEVIVDRETGVNYLYRRTGNAGGLTPLMDGRGNVVVTKPEAY